MNKNFAIEIIESEAGWGQRLDETKYFETYEEAEKFMKDYNKENNLSKVPSWYMYASRPFRVEK